MRVRDVRVLLEDVLQLLDQLLRLLEVVILHPVLHYIAPHPQQQLRVDIRLDAGSVLLLLLLAVVGEVDVLQLLLKSLLAVQSDDDTAPLGPALGTASLLLEETSPTLLVSTTSLSWLLPVKTPQLGQEGSDI